MEVFDNETVRKQIEKYQLKKQYKKACKYLHANLSQAVQLKRRKPKSAEVWQFRITKKYRAYALKKELHLYVFEISDHQ